MHEVKVTSREAATLGALIGEAAMFASSEQQRPILTGVLMLERAGKLTLVATDSYALAVVTTRIDAPAGLRANVVASELAPIAKALAKLAPTYSGDDGPKVSLAIGERELVTDAPAWSMRAHVIEGDFPHFEQLIPVGDGTADAGWPKLSAQYLAKFAKVRCATPSSVKRQPSQFGLVFTSFGALKPCRFDGTSDYADFLGLLMPLKQTR